MPLPGGKAIFYIRSDATRYEVLHELGHFEDWLRQGKPETAAPLGELVICVPVVAREARAQGKSAESHWAHMTVHGVLHLLGFDHERDAEARKMAAREIQILDRLGFSNPYA